jgi:hypothetical protein
MLRATRHILRYAATDTKRGRPSPWKRAELLTVAARLSELLERETSSHLSISSFVDHYLRLLAFPSDVIAALEDGEINLFEASQLARINAQRLALSPVQARSRRGELLSTHLQTKGSGPQLRQRVNELIAARSKEAARAEAGEAQGIDANVDLNEDSELDLEDFDPYDATHLFWDQIKQLGFALRDIGREDVEDEEIDELLKASEPVLSILARIQRRKERRKVMKLEI